MTPSESPSGKEVITYPPSRTGSVKRVTISHHEGCSVRNKGRDCGCDPVVVWDLIIQREEKS